MEERIALTIVIISLLILLVIKEYTIINNSLLIRVQAEEIEFSNRIILLLKQKLDAIG